MFIKTMDNKRLLNTALINDIYISEPEHEQEHFLIVSVTSSGIFTLAEALTLSEACGLLHNFYVELNR